MSDIGHNNPPDMMATAKETTMDLSGWMAENPTIENEDQAREAKIFIDRGSLCIKDLEDERSNQVRPLNEQVKAINDRYRGPRELLERVLVVLKSRIGIFLAEEESRKAAIAAEAARIADEAERAARKAEQTEQEAIHSSSLGELDVDIAARTADADQAFAAYRKAEHQAALAERETKVRIGGGFSRALSLRTKEIIIVDDPVAAIKDIGLGNETITDAITKAAKAYNKVFGKYPAGIRIETERKV